MTTIPDDEVDEGTLDDVDLTDTAPAGPYAATAWRYLRAGWAPLPLPPARKDPPPHGCTGGRAERYPSGPDVQAWIDGPLTWRDVEHGVTREFVGGAGNVGLRMPADVIGLDVDCYDGKPGAATIAAHEERFGLLPLTWMSGSRTDGSGIRFYRVPEGLRWRDLRGGGVEMIRAGHRYAVAWPSLHPGGATYRWTDPDGRVCDGVIPSVHDLAHLPEAWVIGLTGGETAVEQPRAGLTWDAARAWVASGRAADPRCWRVAAATSRAEADLALSSSRHDAALRGVQELAHLHNEGHAGVAAALASLRDAFARAVGSDRDVTEEWARMCAGAVDIAAATVAGHRARCDCDNPLAGLMPAPLQLPERTHPMDITREQFYDADGDVVVLNSGDLAVELSGDGSVEVGGPASWAAIPAILVDALLDERLRQRGERAVLIVEDDARRAALDAYQQHAGELERWVDDAERARLDPDREWPGTCVTCGGHVGKRAADGFVRCAACGTFWTD